MANRYSKTFSLIDIFNNKSLRKVIPLINYKEKTTSSGKVSRTTGGKTVGRLVYDTAKSAGRHYYKPLIAHKLGDSISIGGELVGNYDDAYNGIYEALVGIKPMLRMTANDADIVRDALKEAEKNKRKYGNDSLLYLRQQSIAEIQNMTPKQAEAFMQNVVENIIFSDDYKQTQEKYGLRDIAKTRNRNITKYYHVRKYLRYDQLKEEWEKKVGIR